MVKRQQGWTQSFDLNSISKGTSPAYSLHAEHPSGQEYAQYLQKIAETNELNVRKMTEVVDVKPVGSEELPLFLACMHNWTTFATVI